MQPIANSHGTNHCQPVRSRPIQTPDAAKATVSATRPMTRPKIALDELRAVDAALNVGSAVAICLAEELGLLRGELLIGQHA